jgi:hypothetical protein
MPALLALKSDRDYFDSEKMGWEKTLDLVKMRFDGLQKIQNYFTQDDIDFELCGGYEILNDESA